MKKFFEVNANTWVDAYAVTSLQGRLSNSKDQYGDTSSGVITITTIGGTVLAPSDNVPVDLQRIRELVEQMAVPTFAGPITTNTTNGTPTPPASSAE